MPVRLRLRDMELRWVVGQRSGILRTFQSMPVRRGLICKVRADCWELMEQNLVTLMADNMVGYAMDGIGRYGGGGPDRVAANGDVAGKIGTYTVATMASATLFRLRGVPGFDN